MSSENQQLPNNLKNSRNIGPHSNQESRSITSGNEGTGVKPTYNQSALANKYQSPFNESLPNQSSNSPSHSYQRGLNTFKNINVQDTSDPQSKYLLTFGGDKEERSKKQKKKSNTVRTTKYTLLSWAPLSLLFQFKRAANIYFLIITVLTCMSFSPKSPHSMIGTFAGVLIFTMFKEAYEDFQRYKSDREVNNRATFVLEQDQNRFVQKKFSQVKVGDIIRVDKDCEFPADLLLIHSSKDIVFVDTMNLDGETNLKEKYIFDKDFDYSTINQFQGKVICDNPNEHLDEWDGNIYFQSNKVVNCNIKNLLLRGCFIRNIEYCVGLVVYVGRETKIMKNAKKAPKKISRMMIHMNYMLYTVFLFQLILIATYSSISIFLWREDIGKYHSHYIYFDDLFDNNQKWANWANWAIQLLTFWVAYSHLIPISLYVIIEMLKLGQAYLMGKDVKMYDVETQNYAICRNSDLIEELGQIDFVFSDKTGTLTQNKMIFKKCSVNGIVYGEPTTEDDFNKKGMAFDSISDIVQIMFERNSKQEQQKKLRDFFTILAVCHTVMVDKEPESDKLKYSASSPDELALVQGASDVGIMFIQRNTSSILIQFQDGDFVEYQPLVEFPFDSTRKRMSLIVKSKNKYYLMTKGADSIMIPRVKIDYKMKTQIEADLYKFACEGLRTLVFSQKELSEKEFKEFQQNYLQIKTSGAADKDAQLDLLYDQMEKNLDYLGSSAIEDMLQDGVADTIDRVMQANIRVWVLTGDKQETAIEIGRSCKLIQTHMEEVILSSTSKDSFVQKLQQQTEREIDKQLAIIIDGQTLLWALSDDQTAQKFFDFGLKANSVICCRVSPKQKADVVALAKKQKKYICLSIGDGANDVSMILEAHIGVGIRGKEGTQAVRSADYAISQFRYLERLLLFHGRNGYKRIAQMTCYYFYKNIVLVFTELHFAYYNGFSAQVFFPDWLPTLYNFLFTSWQCLFALMLERDVDDTTSIQNPVLYHAGQLRKFFNMAIFWKWIILAILHGGITFYITFFGLSLPNNSSGLVQDHWVHSTIAFSIIIHLVNYKLFLETRFWNTICYFAGVISLIIYYATLYILSLDFMSVLLQRELNGVFLNVVANFQHLFLIFVLPLVLLIPDMIMKLTPKIFFPNPIDKVLLKYKKDQQNHRMNMIHSIPNRKEGSHPLIQNDNVSLENIIKHDYNYGAKGDSKMIVKSPDKHMLLDENNNNSILQDTLSKTKIMKEQTHMDLGTKNTMYNQKLQIHPKPNQ